MGNLRHLRGWEESSHNWVGHGVEGGRKSGCGMGLAPLRVAGREEGFPNSEGPTHSKGISRDGVRLSGDRRGRQPVSPPCSGSGKPAGVLGPNLCPLGHPQSE